MPANNSGVTWDLVSARQATEPASPEYTISDIGHRLNDVGTLFVFFNLLPEEQQRELTSRMQGGDWSSVGERPGLKRCTYSNIGKLERIVDLLCFGLPPAELQAIRAAIVAPHTPDADMIFEAAQRIEYLAELAGRVRHNWLTDLFRHPNRFFSVFQPLIDLRDGEVMAYEMLIRARGEEAGHVIGAGQLIGAARDSKMLYTLDLLGREVAIKTAARLFSARTNVFINFMPNSVLDAEKSLERSIEMCRATGLGLDRVVFEVVESERIEDMAYLKAMLNSFRSTGFKIALDDLGAGYAGLNYMHQLAPDYVKLDRELVDGCSKSESQRVLISKLIEAAHDLHIRVVAEGIETREDYQCCKNLGADIAQGYFFARPSAEKVYAERHNLLNEVLNLIDKR